MRNYQKYNKAIVPAIVAVVLGILSAFGISEDTSVKEVVILLVTAGAVYFVPNKEV